MAHAETVIVTGGASGLGRAVVSKVQTQGWRPIVLDRFRAQGCECRTVDLADGRAAEAVVREVAETHAGVNAVVTCAGIDACGPLRDVPATDWERVVLVNLLGTAAVARAALPYLQASGGRLVTVASTLGLRALPDATAYCASKFGVVGFTRALAAEVAGQVGVTLLLPGGMDTAFFSGRAEQYRPGPGAQLNPPEDVAEAVLFALRTPPCCEVRELVVTPSREPSWP
jgi:NAD(P)-dependent dehydrogenase (short-subunit alcohol dehydrogenase family)